MTRESRTGEGSKDSFPMDTNPQPAAEELARTLSLTPMKNIMDANTQPSSCLTYGQEKGEKQGGTVNKSNEGKGKDQKDFCRPCVPEGLLSGEAAERSKDKLFLEQGALCARDATRT